MSTQTGIGSAYGGLDVPDRLLHALRVVVLVQQELGVGVIGELLHAHPDQVPADVEMAHQVADELQD